ncbi:CU044_5270 family protein [Nonomuraea sp. NPDC049709]|uniref:CU044_5270 family protein n=1 Tax=Nonomuraea sp. NPDC049709 TaxID=3154736 RepID=UPI00341ACC07
MDDLSAVREQLAGPGPTTETVALGRARLLREIADERPPKARIRAARWTSFGLGLAGAATAAVMIASTVAAPEPVAPPSARQILLAAATSVAKRPAGGSWWGNKLVRGARFHDPTGQYVIQTATAEETWIQAGEVTKPHWIVQRYLGAKPATPQDEAAWRAAGSPSSWAYKTVNPSDLAGNPFDVEAAPGEPESYESRDVEWRLLFTGKTLADMDQLPATPEGLRALMEPSSGDMEGLLHNLQSLIAYVPVPSEVRAAAYRLMASLPGVIAQGPATDQLGRTGQAVLYRQPSHTRSGRQVQTRLIVDSATGEPLAVETLTPDTGELMSFVAIEQSVWTDRKPDFPNPQPRN